MAERTVLISLLETSLEASKQTRDQMKAMLSQSEMMMTLLTDLMNQAQMQNNSFTLENDYFNLLSIVAKCQRTFKMQCD